MKRNDPQAKCGVNPDLWLDYVEGELASDLVKDLDLHAQSCSGCRRHLHGFRLIKKSFSGPEVKMPDDLFFKRLEGKIMQSVQKTHIEAVVPAGFQRFKTLAMATAAVLVLVVGAPFLLPQFKQKGRSVAPPAANLSFEDQLIAMNTGEDPGVFNEVIISHQDSDDFVLEAAAEKLSRMSDQEVVTAFDKMK